MKNTEYKWLITYDDSKYIRELFSFANIKSWDLTYGMRNVNKNSNQLGKEIFIANYEIDLPVPKQLSIFPTANISVAATNKSLNLTENAEESK